MARLGLRGRTSTSPPPAVVAAPATASEVPIDEAATDVSEAVRSSLAGLSLRDPSDTEVAAARSARKAAKAGCRVAPLLRRAAALCEARIDRLVSLEPGEYPPGVALGELQLEGEQLQAMATLWPPLRATLEAHATAQEWLEASAGAAGGAAAAGGPTAAAASRRSPGGSKAKGVRFSSYDGSHLQPPHWGDEAMGDEAMGDGAAAFLGDDGRGAAQRSAAAAARSESDEAIARLQPLAVQTAAWHRLAAPLSTERRTLLRLLREALGAACDEAGTAATLRTFVHAELARLEAGGALLGGRLSSLLRSAVRQQLRKLFEAEGDGAARGAAMTASVPRGRGIGFLKDVDSAARVLSNALYEYHQLRPAALEPQARALFQRAQQQRDASALQAVRAMPDAAAVRLLTFAEAHATLRHVLPMLCAEPADGASPATADPAWARLTALLRMAREARCDDEALFLPLLDIVAFQAQLASEVSSAVAIQWCLDWTPAQEPANKRTRAAGAAAGAAAALEELGSSDANQA